MKIIQTSNKDLFVLSKLLKVYGELKLNRKLTKKEKKFFKKLNVIIKRNSVKLLDNNYLVSYINRNKKL